MNNQQILQIFRGKNFMTPHPMQYFRCKLRGRVAYIELSEGSSIDGGPLYGVTFRRANGEELWKEEGRDADPSGCFHSLQKAREHIDKYKGGDAMKKPFDPIKLQQTCQKFIMGYLTSVPVNMPSGMNEDDYKQAMNALTEAMALAWVNGYEEGNK